MNDSKPSDLHKQLQPNALKNRPVRNNPADKLLKILSLEDTISDQQLIDLQLKKSGIQHQVLFVDTQLGFENALSNFNPDIILSDYNLPGYHGVDAFYTAKKMLPQVPFILVSGTIGEQRAVELIKGGVTDYVIKDALFTLPLVITRAIKEADERRQKLQADENLWQTAQRLERAQAVAHLGNWEANPATGTGYWSDETLRIYGLEPGDNIQSVDTFLDHVHPEDIKYVSAIVQQSICELKEASFQHRIVRKNGDVRYIHTEAKHEFDAAGKHKIIHGTTHDITESKLAQEKLKQSETRLARAQTVAHLGSWEMDPETTLSTLSEECCRIYGLEPGKTVISISEYLAIVHPDDLERMSAAVAEAVNNLTDVSIYHRIVHKNGDVRYLHTEAKNQFDANGKYQMLHGTAHDITVQHLAAEKLKQSQARLARAQEVAHLGNWELDLNTGAAFWDDETLRICGLTPGQNTHAMPEYIAMIHPDDLAFVTKEIEDSIVNGTDSSIEHRLLRPDGTIRYIHNMGTHQPHPTGKKRIMHGIVQDITERKMAEIKQRESEEVINEIFANTTDYICSLDKNLNLVSYNEAYRNNFAAIFKREPVIGEYYLNILPEAQRAQAEIKYLEVLKGNVVINEADYDFNGRHFWFITKFIPIKRNGEITGLAFFSTDITERKMAELKLRESEQNLKDVFDNTADYISSFDSERRLLSCNKAFASRFRTLANTEPVLGIAYPNMFTNQPGAAPGTNFARALTGESISVIEEYDYQGSKFWFSVRYNPIIRNQQITGVAIFSNDITESKLAEDKLSESRAALKDVFDNTSDAIVSVDKEHRLLSFNKAFVQNFTAITGKEPVLGHIYYSTVNPELQVMLKLNFERAMAGAQFTSVNQYFAGTKARWFSTRYSPIMRNGEVTGVAVFSSDITKQKNAETLLHKSFDELQIASEKQSAILNTLPANIALLDKNGVVIKVNDAWRKFAYENNMNHGNSGLGENYITVSEAAGGPDASLAHKMAEGLKQVIAGKLEKFSMEYPCHSATAQRWFRAEVTPLEGYDELGAVVMHLDITDRNKAEEEVKNLNRHLEQKIAERTAQLEVANKEMEAFSYTVSHDLRSPLQVINGYASILERKYKPQLDAGAAELLAGIKSNTLHMSQLIADLLNFSHLGRAELKRSPICMKDLVTVVVNELKAQTPNFKHSITILPLKGVTADAGLMHQVWVNLIANAIKYSSNKPNPTIEIGITRIKNEDVFYVKDNGAGFDMMYYDKLFTVFHRLHKPSEFEGTGVGLALVHSVITRHGGRVWAEAKVNEGATFYFTLPDVGN